MALSMKNVCLCNSGISLIFKKSKYVIYGPHKNSSRQLRGSRIGKELDKAESKFQQLLKTLKQSKKLVIDAEEIPETALKTVEVKDEVTVQNEKNISLEDVYKRLEGKITPLKKLTYPRQLERKYSKCLTLLRMYGEKLRSLKVPITLGSDRLPCPVELMLPSSVIEEYRNQDEFSIGNGVNGDEKTVGYFLENFTGETETICVGPEELVIIKDIHKEFIKDFQDYIRQSSLPAYWKNEDGGNWKSVSVRSNKLGELMGIIVMHPQNLTMEQLQSEKSKLKNYFEGLEKNYQLKSLYLQVCSQQRCSHEQAPYELLSGDSHIVEDVNGAKYKISPESYFFSNTYSIEAICNFLKKICRVKSSTTVLDIFCGTGPISLTFSPNVKKCIGIDVSSQAIDDAKYNAEINNAHNVEFLKGNPDFFLGEILQQDYHEDLLVIIGPNRTEISKASLKRLRECKHLKKIIYITSKPRATVENFVRLAKPSGGESYLGKYFVPLYAIPVDLAPQTEHYGLIVMYQRL